MAATQRYKKQNTKIHTINIIIIRTIVNHQLISDREMPLPPSKASKAHPKISNTLHLHVVIMHIHHAIATSSLWEKILRH